MAHLPHLQSFVKDPLLFITTCTLARQPLLANEPVHQILRDIFEQSSERNGWFVGQYLLMPDHVHLFAAPACGAASLARWLQMWKSTSAKRIKTELKLPGSVWQEEYFDRFVRSPADYSEKWHYVRENPVRAGHALRAGDWPFSGTIHELRW